MSAAVVYVEPILTHSMGDLIRRATRGGRDMSPEDSQACREIADKCEINDRLRRERQPGKIRKVLKH